MQVRKELQELGVARFMKGTVMNERGLGFIGYGLRSGGVRILGVFRICPV